VPAAIDRSNWSGEGAFTALCLDAIASFDDVIAVRVEDAPASRAGAGYNFISNEIYLHAPAAVRREVVRVLGLPVWRRRRSGPAFTPGTLAQRLAAKPAIGEADYVDDTMIQFLRTERIVPPYQTRGIKAVEMVRIYLVTDTR
jgi:hypothetical protein